MGEEQYRISNWSGGKTRELYLWPGDGSYADRNFRVRISSATVELSESDFTYLAGVERYLMKLSGDMVLTVNGGEKVDMTEGRILHFSGEDQVHCEGCATDFNLMLKGAQGSMSAQKAGQSIMLVKDREYFLYASKRFDLTTPDGTKLTLQEGESCHVMGEEGSLLTQGYEGVLPVVEICKKEGM